MNVEIVMGRSALAIVAFAGALMSCGMTEHTVGDKTSTDVFGAGDLRAVAEAACRGDGDAVRALAEPGMRALLELGADPNHRVDRPSGQTAVLFAATYDNGDLLRVLLEHGGNPNAVELTRHHSALTQAISSGMGVERDNWENYETLLAAGADLDMVISGRETAAIFASSMNRYCLIISMIEDHGYSHDLYYLLLHVKSGFVPESSRAYHCKTDLISYLEGQLNENEWNLYLEWAEGREFQDGPVERS